MYHRKWLDNIKQISFTNTKVTYDITLNLSLNHLSLLTKNKNPGTMKFNSEQSVLWIYVAWQSYRYLKRFTKFSDNFKRIQTYLPWSFELVKGLNKYYLHYSVNYTINQPSSAINSMTYFSLQFDIWQTQYAQKSL